MRGEHYFAVITVYVYVALAIDDQRQDRRLQQLRSRIISFDLDIAKPLPSL